MTLTLSHTAIQEYLNCRRMYMLSYVKNIRRRTASVALITGRAIHAWREAYAQGLSPEACDNAAAKEFNEVDKALLSKDDQVKIDTEKHRAIAIVAAYREAWDKHDKVQYQKFITETRGEEPLIERVNYKGYLDCLAQDAAGDWWVLDTKTASKGTVNAAYFERLSFDWQLMGYLWLARKKLGVHPRGIIYDVIIKTQHYRRKTETHAQFVNRLKKLYIDEWKTQGLFERHEIEVPIKNVDRWFKQVSVIAAEMRDMHESKTKMWPMNTGQCLGKYGACKFLPICASGKVDKLIYDRG